MTTLVPKPNTSQKIMTAIFVSAFALLLWAVIYSRGYFFYEVHSIVHQVLDFRPSMGQEPSASEPLNSSDKSLTPGVEPTPDPSLPSEEFESVSPEWLFEELIFEDLTDDQVITILSEDNCQLDPSTARVIHCEALTPSQNDVFNQYLERDGFMARQIIERPELADELLREMLINNVGTTTAAGAEASESPNSLIVIASIVYASICLLVALIVLGISLPIYLYSDDALKSKKAGGLVKTSLGFVVAVGTTLLGGFALR